MRASKRNGFRQTVLPMFSARKQRMTRGAPNASRTSIRNEGRWAAMAELLASVFQMITERSLPTVTEVENINPDTMTDSLHRRLAGQPELTEPTGEVSELEAFHDTLRQLRSGKPNRLLRESREFIQQVVTEVFQALSQAVDVAAGDAPFQVAHLRQQIADVFNNLEVPEASNTSLVTLKNGIGGITYVRNVGPRMAESARQFLVSQLSERARQAASGAIREFAAELVGEELRVAIQNQTLQLNELGERFADLPHRMSEIEAYLAAKCDTLRKRNVYAETSVFLPLPGPSQSEVETELIRRHKCGNRLELTAWILRAFQSELRQLISAENPALAKSAGIGELLIRLPTGDVSDAFERLFEASLGDGHSVFEIIERFGIEQTAQELTERAEPLCHLKERDTDQFNVTPLDHMVVRLPRPTSARDPEIRARLAAAFRSLGNCSILDAGESDREVVSVVKIKLGWPIAIEAGNAIMLQHYAASQNTDHHPHLVGLLKDSPDGQVISRFVRLAEDGRHS